MRNPGIGEYYEYRPDGMGEPLANMDNVVRALKLLISPDGFQPFQTGRVTVSTSGLVPEIGDAGPVS
jgi:23S rRNA (adenine2503-C2)-methyltransferase